MTEFVFNFEAPQSNNTESSGKQIDWAARTKYLVENCGTKDKAETEIFIVSGVIDLGLQAQEDAKMEWTGDAASEATELEKNPEQYFQTLPNDKGIATRYKRWKSKPQRTVAVTADNPNRMLNQAQFFAEDGQGEDAPLRMILNNEWYVQGVGKVVNKMGYSCKENRNDDGSWSLKNNTVLYKLGAAVDALDEKKQFKPGMLGKLIGKPILCEFQVSSTVSNGKEYLNEKISFKGAVPSMMKALVPTLDPKYMYVVNFKGPQNPEVLKNLRQSVITTMQNALDFEGSDIQKALIEIGRIKPKAEGEHAAPQEDKTPVNKPTKEEPEQKASESETVNVDDFDDIPF